MSYDPTKVFVDAETKFGNARGWANPAGIIMNGQRLIPPPLKVPQTTWGDVFAFGANFLNYTDPDTSYCKQFAGSKYATCMERRVRYPNTEFDRAKANWETWQPIKSMEKQFGFYQALAKLVERQDQIYPFNEQFWGLGRRYAIARSAYGSVQSPFSMAIESLAEAANEAPALIKKKLGGALDSAKRVVSGLDLLFDILKWGSVAAGLGMLYWYVLRPKPKQRQLR
jgi:hypothetical protein